MKLVRANKARFTFEFSRKEKQLLVRVLQMYPLVPPSHYQLSKGEEGAKHHEDQRCLEEAVAEQRRENRKKVQGMLNEPERFHEIAGGLQCSLTHAEIDWLLQTLNDVRVGAWLMLGEPGELDLAQLNEISAPYLLAMEGAGYFQAGLLAALGHRQLETGES